MEKIEQFIYTSSPWGKGGSGWMVFRYSKNFVSGTEKNIYDLLKYKTPQKTCSYTYEDLKKSNYPVQFVCTKIPSGEHVLIQTCYTGTRWWESRSGDFWSQCYIIPKENWKQISKTNSFNWFRSPSIDVEYPEDMRQKAKAVCNREIDFEYPPLLPSLESLFDLEINKNFDFENVISRVEPAQISQLGNLILEVIRREKNKVDNPKALIFDASNEKSLDVMALILELLPEQMRLNIQYATYFHDENISGTGVNETFAFYGTILESEESDINTGLYTKIEKGNLIFNDTKDIEVFKSIINICGSGLFLDDFDSLINCWEVAAGRITDIKKIRESLQFANQFNGLKDEIENGLINVFADYNYDSLPEELSHLAIIAGFEFQMNSFIDENIITFSDYSDDISKLVEVLSKLTTAKSRRCFLNKLIEYVKTIYGLPSFANLWMENRLELEKIIAINDSNDSIDEFIRNINTFEKIRTNLVNINADNIDDNIKKLDEISEYFFGYFQEINDVKNVLKYKKELNSLNSMSDIKDFLENTESLGVDDNQRGNDIKKKIDIDNITDPEKIFDLFELCEDISLLNLNKKEIIEKAVHAAFNQGKSQAIRQEKLLSQKEIERIKEEYKRTPKWVTLIMITLCLIIGFAFGFFFDNIVVQRNKIIKSVQDSKAEQQLDASEVLESKSLGEIKALEIDDTEEANDKNDVKEQTTLFDFNYSSEPNIKQNNADENADENYLETKKFEAPIIPQKETNYEDNSTSVSDTSNKLKKPRIKKESVK